MDGEDSGLVSAMKKKRREKKKAEKSTRLCTYMYHIALWCVPKATKHRNPLFCEGSYPLARVGKWHHH